jgi:hypothetical protein
LRSLALIKLDLSHSMILSPEKLQLRLSSESFIEIRAN